jgi:NAD(P)-dependent dehydrogenase (short-subunit alcohol dehydrogenase family)
VARAGTQHLFLALGAGAIAGLLGGQRARLRGQVAAVTGGSRGLGLLLARELGRAGSRVAICARDADELERACRYLRPIGEVLAVPCDVADRTQAEGFVATVSRHFGRVDVLVNNAGIIDVGPLAAMGVDDFRRAMEVIFWGTVHTTLAVLPQMRARRAGRIVNVTSIGGKIAVPHMLPYGCAKFATVGFSEGLRAELAPDGVRVVTIVPGLMRTGSFQRARFTGRVAEEYRWFSLGAALPVISMDAERAARQIVRAAARGDAERILSLPAQIAARIHGLFPGLTTDALGWVNRLLLPPPDGRARAEGLEIDAAGTASLLRALTRLGRVAARRFNESPVLTAHDGGA